MILVFVHGDLRAGVPSGSAWVLGPTLLADAVHNVPTVPLCPLTLLQLLWSTIITQRWIGRQCYDHAGKGLQALISKIVFCSFSGEEI